MHLSISPKKTQWTRYSIFAIMIVACIACSSASNDPSLTPSSQLLPGEEIWKQGISSFLFGTNDTHEWSAQNFETRPSIQQSLRNEPDYDISLDSYLKQWNSVIPMLRQINPAAKFIGPVVSSAPSSFLNGF